MIMVKTAFSDNMLPKVLNTQSLKAATINHWGTNPFLIAKIEADKPGRTLPGKLYDYGREDNFQSDAVQLNITIKKAGSRNVLPIVKLTTSQPAF
jgi:hypothetical protein